MRTKYSLYNVISGLISQAILVVLGFVSRKVFVDTLGLGMQGVNSTLTSIITMLSLTELGIGTAIICNLYKPLADDDRPKIISLLQLYSSLYKKIAMIVSALGLAICPFLPYIFAKKGTETSLSRVYITAVFLLFLADVVISYLFAYKRSIITADQKNFIITIVSTIVSVSYNIGQIVILILTKNFILYLIVKIAFRLIENFTIAYIANKKYPYIKTKEKMSVDKDIKDNIVGNTKALALHYIGNYLISGTDMLIITKFLGTVVSGAYSNYQLITQTLRNVLGQFSTGITASFGNLIAEGDRDKLYEVFKKSFFIAFVLSNFSAVSLFVLFNPFINLWIHTDEAVLPMHVVAIIVVNFYFTVVSEPIGTLRASAGLFRPDRYLHIALALLNLVVSIGLVITKAGIFGVFLGTFLCLCIKEITVLPLIVYKQLLGRRLWDYQKSLFFYSAVTAVSTVATWFCAQLVTSANPFVELVLKACLCVVIPNGIVLLVFFRSPEFKYVVGLVKKIINKVLKRNSETA